MTTTPAMRQKSRTMAERVYLPVSGLLPVDKPTGMTSHDVVHQVRRHFHIKKVGHGGTLDPAATGLLMLLLGKGTKASHWVMGGDKAYEGTLTLGATTHTQDAEGEVLQEAPWQHLTREQLEALLPEFTGDIEQVPPMVSAIKKAGVPLYKMARKGQSIAREPRPVTIHEIALLDWAPPRARFRMRCSKGTYVRTLCHDLGQRLGCGGHLSQLRRTASGDYRVEQAATLEEVLAWTPDELAERCLPVPPAAFAKQDGPCR